MAFLAVVPLAVLAIDVALKGEVPDSDLYLTLGLYIIGAGAASRSMALLSFSILLAGGYLIAYGTVASLPDCPHVASGHEVPGYVLRYGPAIFFTALIVMERYNRHVAGDEPFWKFG